MGRALVLIVIGVAVGWLVGAQYPGPANAVLRMVDPLTEQYLGISVSDEDSVGEEDAGGEVASEADAEAQAAVVAGSAADDEDILDNSSSGVSAAQSLDQYRAWIDEARARHPYPESEDRMYAVMMCESGGEATAVNRSGPYSGLFQYSSATWNGDWNTYRDQNILDPQAQIFATALAWNLGMQSQWSCYSHTN